MQIGFSSERIAFINSFENINEGLISLTAMLNRWGQAILYCGVRSDGYIIGCPFFDVDFLIKKLNLIKPSINPTIKHLLIENRLVIKISAKSKNKNFTVFNNYYCRYLLENKEEFIPFNETLITLNSPKQELTFNKLDSFMYSLFKNISNKFNKLGYLMSNNAALTIYFTNSSNKILFKITSNNLFVLIDDVTSFLNPYFDNDYNRLSFRIGLCKALIFNDFKNSCFPFIKLDKYNITIDIIKKTKCKNIELESIFRFYNYLPEITNEYTIYKTDIYLV